MPNIQIFHDHKLLPNDWDNLAATNTFLSKRYCAVLQYSAPENMKCHFVAFQEKEKLVGIAIAQYLDVSKLQDFGSRDHCFRTWVRRLLFKRFASHVLFMGNNMLSGENSFSFDKSFTSEMIAENMIKASDKIIAIYNFQDVQIDVVNFKDFVDDMQEDFAKAYKDAYRFSIQPAMLFDVRESWKSFADYVSALSKKYRDQYKRALKKNIFVEKRFMDFDEIEKYRTTINDLYLHVANSAPFNTFYLSENHFEVFKKCFQSDFVFTGYFLDGNMIGFNTMIKNGNVLETYFLGYDEKIQKEHMLYLNMLYNMIEYAISNKFSEINFARTALEIKSSIGAKPQMMHGYMKHRDKFINKNLEWIFKKVEPQIDWHQRHPFKV